MSSDDQRPLSPHLQIYKLPLTARLSIFHRATGVVLFIALLFMVLSLAMLAQSAENWRLLQPILFSIGGKVVLFAIVFSLYYHLCNGTRHLFWDIGQGLTLTVAQQSGKAVIVVSVVLTLITWFLTSFMALR